jgi:hypothetical protein
MVHSGYISGAPILYNNCFFWFGSKAEAYNFAGFIIILANNAENDSNNKTQNNHLCSGDYIPP